MAACAGGPGASVATTGTLPGGGVAVTERPPGSSSASSTGSTAGTPASSGAADSTSTSALYSRDEGLHQARLTLAQALGLDVGSISVSTNAPSSPQADAVLQWAGGTAEVDSTAGRIYGVGMQQAAGGSSASGLTEEGLTYQALQMATKLGWTTGMLTGLGFKQEQLGTLDAGTGVFTLDWSQYDNQGVRGQGLVEVRLDAGNAALLGFSVSLGSQGPSLAGSISEQEAMGIAQTTIFLETDKPKLSLAGDGALLLADKAVSETLGMVTDRKATKNKPMLLWVIEITGTQDAQIVGGTVYIDAKTGVVVHYVPFQDPSTTTTTTVAGVAGKATSPPCGGLVFQVNLTNRGLPGLASLPAVSSWSSLCRSWSTHQFRVRRFRCRPSARRAGCREVRAIAGWTRWLSGGRLWAPTKPGPGPSRAG